MCRYKLMKTHCQQHSSLFVPVSVDLSPVQVPLIQTPLGQNDSESDTDSSSGFSTPVASSGEITKEETTTEKRSTNSELHCNNICRDIYWSWAIRMRYFTVFYFINIIWGQYWRYDWFFLGRDVSILTVSMDTILHRVFFPFETWKIWGPSAT